ncbi:MAG: ATP phosphoribosyltransferase regulatory subunit [Actinobacteria bacterium]|nr:ATP phosphoribosyltransferase regulatory subunit [Actinomycetota bacterium]
MREADVPGLPIGARDVLPAEAGEIREIEASVARTFELAGYREVITPVLELADVLDRAQDGGLARTFRLFDSQGRVLALRPDLTIPVARLVATRMDDHPGPIRLRYAARRFRTPTPGRPGPTEVREAGLELVGLDGPEADAEVIALVVTALRDAGLPDIQVNVGDVEVGVATLNGLGVGDEDRLQLGIAAADRNVVAWRRIVARLELPEHTREFLSAFPTLRGSEDILDVVRREAPTADGACAWLERTFALLDGLGVRDAVRLDLGILRDWAYYSGVVFEAYADGESRPVAVGGRYDGLVGRFGRDRPAVGASITLDAVHRVVGSRSGGGRPLRDGVALAGGLVDASAVAAAARRAGCVVVCAGTHEDADALALRDGLRFVADMADDRVVLLDRSNGSERIGADLAALVRAAIGGGA